MEVTAFFEKDTSTLQYVVADKKEKICAVFDSVLNYNHASGHTSTEACDEIIEFIKKKEYKVQWIIDTHAHADHISGAQYLRDKLKTTYAIGEKITLVQETFKPIYDLHELKVDGSQFDKLFKDGEEFKIGSLPVRVFSTPGHTPACMSYFVNNEACFVGDTFFMPDGGSGRCDFPQGSAEQMWKSLQKLLALGDDVVCYVCHDYQPNGRELKYKTTMGEQRKNNVHLKDISTMEEYVAMRTKRDATLSMPKLIIPSIQVNIDGAKLPEKKEGDKHAHLKIPLNVLK